MKVQATDSSSPEDILYCNEPTEELAFSPWGVLYCNETISGSPSTNRRHFQSSPGPIIDQRAEINDSLKIADTLKDKNIYKKLLLAMALYREKKPRHRNGNPNHKIPLTCMNIPEGFEWNKYPPLEEILRANMCEYYDLSSNSPQSIIQRNFNNRLVALIRKTATENGWVFDPNSFSDKKLRDRIRCFFKTHIQNAKKRLRTMLKKAGTKMTLKSFVRHYNLGSFFQNSDALPSDVKKELHSSPSVFPCMDLSTFTDEDTVHSDENCCNDDIGVEIISAKQEDIQEGAEMMDITMANTKEIVNHSSRPKKLIEI